jgi:hypothetical protein
MGISNAHSHKIKKLRLCAHSISSHSCNQFPSKIKARKMGKIDKAYLITAEFHT